MATRFLEGNLDLDTLDSKDKIPFGVEDDGGLAIRRGTSWSGVAATNQGVERIPVSRFASIAASATLAVSDHGGVFEADSTTSVVLTLPSTQKGLTFTLVVGQLTSSGGHAFSPAAADKIMGNGFTATDDKDAICTAATDRVGDSITLVGDGVDGWYITSVVGTWARE